MSSVQSLTAFQRDLLFVMSDTDDPSGLDLKSELESYYTKEINHGRLYPNLDELVDMGLVDKGQKNLRTNTYNLTDEGIEVITERRNWEADQLTDADVGTDETSSPTDQSA